MEAESHWKHQEIVGVVCQGRLGLGHYSEKRWSRADVKARRGLVVQRVREAAEEERQVKAIGLASQGRWTQWDQAQERPLSWKELWQTDQGRLSFLLRSVTDLLPTPRNIKIWGGEEDPSCNQCGAVSCTLNHILTGCPKALAEGRYRWRHDKVLMEIAKWVEQQRVKANNKQAHPPEAITFVREGDKAHKTGTVAKNLPSSLQRASDWSWEWTWRGSLSPTGRGSDLPPTRYGLAIPEHENHHSCWAHGALGREASHVPPTEKSQVPGPGRRSCFKGVACNQLPYWSWLPRVPSKIGALLPPEVGLEPKQLKKATRDIAAAAESSSRWLWLKRAHSWNPSAGEG